MKVLVTGASGMLGRAVAQCLIQRGHTVTVLQRRRADLDCAQVNGNITDSDVTSRAVAGQDAVVHLAAKVDVTGSWSDYVATNVTATRQLLAQAGAAGAVGFVYVSSPSVAHAGHALFGTGVGPADPATARGFYSRSKAIAERLVLGADSGADRAIDSGADGVAGVAGLATVAIRPHLVWGPGDTQLIGRVVQRARTGRLPMISSGAALIDTTYVDNAAAAIVAGLDRIGAAHGLALVVSNGEPRPVAEIIGRVCAAACIAPPTRRVPYPVAFAAGAAVDGIFGAWGALASYTARVGAPPEPPITRFLAEQLATAHWFDQRRTRELLQWQPTVSLDEGFERLAEFYAQEGSAS